MNKLLNICMTVVLLGIFSQNAFALYEEQTFKKAKTAFEKKQLTTLTKYTNQLKAKRYILAPYAEHWLVSARMNQLTDKQVLNFLNRTPDYAFNQGLRAQWLKKLGSKNDWAQFFAQHDLYAGNDAGVACTYWTGKSALGQAVDREMVKALWLSGKQQPSQCNRLFKDMAKKGVISKANKYERLRLALLNGKTKLAKGIAVKLPGISSKTARLIDRARKNPERFLSRKVASFNSPFGVELNLFAVDRLARKNVGKAVRTFKKVKHKFNQKNRATAWGLIAYRASVDLDPKALTYYGYASSAPSLTATLASNDVYLKRNGWKARAALRAESWKTLLSFIAQMPPVQAERARWRYWKARALKATYPKSPRQLAVADDLFMNLGQERHYYGWLAAEEVGMPMAGSDAPQHMIDEHEVKRIANIPQIQRAVLLKKLEMRWQAKSEWFNATKKLSDTERLAAASYAQKIGWHDISINTADNTTEFHNFDLRYPTPYRQYFQHAASDEALDEAWVFGLVRQESRFMDYAKSRVGASGLMQLMPKTARWAAKKKGMRGFKRKNIHDVRTNVALGTFYMRHTLNEMNGQAVMATAAYNAGPSRALKWMANRPLEAAIYMETIPFNETRNYVQRVMANAHLYAPRIGAKLRTLKQRIGTIPAKRN